MKVGSCEMRISRMLLHGYVMHYIIIQHPPPNPSYATESENLLMLKYIILCTSCVRDVGACAYCCGVKSSLRLQLVMSSCVAIVVL